MRTFYGLCVLACAFIALASSSGHAVNDGYGDFVLVPAGSFKMGDNFEEGDPRERPVHTVDLDAFYIGRFPVTNAEFAKFRDDAGYNNPKFWPGGTATPKEQSRIWERTGAKPGHENNPASGITWDQATAYCLWLSARTGHQYRLPTEAEWEKAARGTDQRRFPWGNSIDPSYTSYAEKPLMAADYYNGSKRGDLQTHSNASPYGVFYMEGGVFEWCSDWYSPNYYSFSPRKNPTGPQAGAYRVLRGASQYEEPWELRTANRSSGAPSNQNHHLVGFRCARQP